MSFSLSQKASRVKAGAMIALGIIATVWAGNAPAAGVPAALLIDQAVFTNNVPAGHGYGHAVAVQGTTAVLGVDGGDPFASLHVFERTAASWKELGRLSDSRAQIFDGFGYSVAVEGHTIVAGDIETDGFTGSAYVYARNDGPGLNAWNILDGTTSGIGPGYWIPLSASQQASLLTNAWRFSATARMVHDLEGDVCMYFSYGNSARRFLFFLDFTSDGALYARLPGASPTDYVLAAGGAGADEYHLHEIEFNPTTGMATYSLDGTAVKTWAGQVLGASPGIRWGAGSTAGTGSLNVNQVRFEVVDTETVLADYDAGTPTNPPPDLNPLAQGWSQLTSPAAFTSAGPLTPDAGTLWTRQARLMAAGGATGDQLGTSIDLSGDTLVAGASRRNGGGAAYVFVRQGTNWIEQQRLLPSPPVASARFGESVAIDGDTIIVGAPTGGASPPPGRAYVFVRMGSNWIQQAILAPTDNLQGRDFGVAVGISGDRAAIGAPSSGFGGAIYFTERNGATWGALKKVLPDPVTNGERFGSSIAMDGDTAVAGSSSVPASYVFVRAGSDWLQAARRIYTGGETIGDVHLDGETIIVGVPTGNSGALYIQVPDYSDAGAVSDYTDQLLYYPAASGGAFPKSRAAFRYKHLLYGEENGNIRARFETISTLYGTDERQRAMDAEDLLWRSLSLNPEDTSLGDRLLDIYYDRTVAESIFTKDLLVTAEKARFGPPIAPPAAPGAFYIDAEIPAYESALATNRAALQGYFDLLKRGLGVQQYDGPPADRWAARILGFSSEYSPGNGAWDATQALGVPDTYPDYGDITTAWASLTGDGQREFLELRYDNPAPIHTVSIYETWNPGAVDSVSVRNPNTGQWEEVWSGTAAPAGTNARIFAVTFPLTAYRVDAVRIELDSPAVPSWNEIDAVSISGPGQTVTVTDSNFAYRMFQTLVPGRALMAATYTNQSGLNVPVTTNTMLFSGYKDLVLLFDQLRDYGRTAEKLARLLISRDGAGDRDQAAMVASDAERFLFLQGTLLKNMFPSLPPEGDPSGLAEAISGWSRTLTALGTIQQLLAGGANLLGFADDFLMYVQKFSGQTEFFDSYDAFRVRLDPNTGSNPLRAAKQAHQDALNSYASYRGFRDQLSEQFDNSSITYRDRLRDIVGVFPNDPAYTDDPTAHPGSELDQQYRSIELARLRIRRNQTEINNLADEVQIEINRAASVSYTVVRYGNMQAELTTQIGHIKAAQAAASALADALSVENLTKGLAFGFVLNAGAQFAAEEGVAHLEAQKERLAAEEQAQIEGIESRARVKTLLLGMRTLAVDSQEAALLLTQELNRLVALYREKEDLEQQIAEQDASVASRYFADPLHRLASQADMVRANLAFDEAQKWLYFMIRALEYKWNTPFRNYSFGGRAWSADTLFKLRNATELEQMFQAMDSFENQIQLPKDDYFDWFSVREDFFGYKRTNNLGQILSYTDPVTGATVDAIAAFRSRLSQLQDAQGNIALEFSTVTEIPGGTFFRGPRFNTQGQVISKGLFLDKIRWLKINLPGNHTLGRTQLTGELRYGGTGFIRNFDVGTFDPLRPDRLRDELTAYATRFWFFHAPSATWRFTDALSSPVTMQLSDDPRVPPSVQELDIFKERSVATTGWVLTIPTKDGGQPVLNIGDLDDVEIYFFHYAVTRP